MRSDKLKRVAVNKLQRGRFQPRTETDGQALRALAESVRNEGVIQPLFVRKVRRGGLEIVAGERRWRAAKMAGLPTVPAVVSKLSDRAAASIGLIENLQREALNPIDQARAIERLIHEFEMTHEEVAQTIGRSRATVSNLLRLLDLPEDVKTLVSDGELDMGHARALLPLSEPDQVSLAQSVAEQGLSVREVERTVRENALVEERPAQGKLPKEDLTSIAQRLEQCFGEAIALTRDRNGQWSLTIACTDANELRGGLNAVHDLLQEDWR